MPEPSKVHAVGRIAYGLIFLMKASLDLTAAGPLFGGQNFSWLLFCHRTSRKVWADGKAGVGSCVGQTAMSYSIPITGPLLTYACPYLQSRAFCMEILVHHIVHRPIIYSFFTKFHTIKSTRLLFHF